MQFLREIQTENRSFVTPFFFMKSTLLQYPQCIITQSLLELPVQKKKSVLSTLSSEVNLILSDLHLLPEELSDMNNWMKCTYEIHHWTEDNKINLYSHFAQSRYLWKMIKCVTENYISFYRCVHRINIIFLK